MLHLFTGLVCVLLYSVVCDSSYLISGVSSFELQSTRRQGPSSQDEFGHGEFKTLFLKHQVGDWDGKENLLIKLEC